MNPSFNDLTENLSLLKAQTEMSISDNDEKENLYNLIKESRDFLWFGNYKKLITKNEIENIAKKLDLSVETLWWHTEMPSGSTWIPFG